MFSSPFTRRAALLAALASVGPLVSAQEATLKPADNLVVEGIPPIPASIVETVGRYTEFRSAAFGDWHPSRKEMLIRTRFGDTNQVHRVAMPGGARYQLTFFPESVSGASHGPTDTDSFVFSRDVGGNEQYQFYRYDVATGDSTLLTDGKSRNTDLLWSTDGRRVLYTSNRRNGEDMDLYVMEPDNPRSDRMLAQLKGGGWGPLDWSDDDRFALMIEYRSVNESHLHLMDTSSGQITRLTAEGPEPVAYQGAAFARGGRGIYYTSDEGSEFTHLRYRDLSTGHTTVITGGIPWDVDFFELSRDGRKLAFVTNEAGASRLHIMDTGRNRVRRIEGIPTGVINSIDWHSNSRDLALNLQSARSASDVYALDTKNGKLTRWTTSELGGLNPETFTEPELVRWKSFDGLEITGWLYMPPARFTGPRPVLVDIHGGPEGQSRPGFMGRLNYYINELGVAVIEPNVRGSTGFGKTFVKLDNGFLRENSYKDIGALFDWVASQPRLDARKVMVLGGSYGGHMSFAISYLYPDRIAAAMPVVGMSSLVSFLENTSAYRRDLRRVEYGDERDPKMREYLLRIAPMNNAEKITKPIFVVQGANDPRVPLSEAQQFVDKIKGVNPNVWYLVAKDEGHGFAKKRNRDYQMYAMVMFMRKFLLGQ